MAATLSRVKPPGMFGEFNKDPDKNDAEVERMRTSLLVTQSSPSMTVTNP
jgi:hypothetical protein